jgi:VIT1/CCC1 family predicted Fe2+/Mn2+ transporter
MADRPVIVKQVVIREQDRPAGEIVRDIIHDVETLIRTEVKLAKTELRETIRAANRAAPWFVAAAGAALFAGACFVVTLIAALMYVVPLWLAALFLSIMLAAAAAALFLVGRERIKRVQPLLPQTTETVRENTEWLKRRAS